MIRLEGRIFNESLSRSEELLKYKAKAKSLYDYDTPLQLITSVITERHSTIGIYCLGKRIINQTMHQTFYETSSLVSEKIHYYLLVFVASFEPDSAAAISDIVFKRSGGNYTVTVLLHRKNSLKQNPGDQQYFFYQAMEKSELLFQHPTKAPYLPYTTMPSRNFTSAVRYWEQRLYTSNCLVLLITDDACKASRLHLVHLHYAVEQICLGLIRLFLGYRPNHFSLKYLLELCAYFSPLASIFLRNETDYDNALLKLLTSGVTDLRFGSIEELPQQDYMVLKQRSLEFISKATLVATEEIHRLGLEAK